MRSILLIASLLAQGLVHAESQTGEVEINPEGTFRRANRVEDMAEEVWRTTQARREANMAQLYAAFDKINLTHPTFPLPAPRETLREHGTLPDETLAEQINSFEGHLREGNKDALVELGRIEFLLNGSDKEKPELDALAKALLEPKDPGSRRIDPALTLALLARHSDKGWFHRLEELVAKRLAEKLNASLDGIFSESNVCLNPGKMSSQQKAIVSKAASETFDEYQHAVMTANYGLRGALKGRFSELVPKNDPQSALVFQLTVGGPFQAAAYKYADARFTEHMKRCTDSLERIAPTEPPAQGYPPSPQPPLAPFQKTPNIHDINRSKPSDEHFRRSPLPDGARHTPPSSLIIAPKRPGSDGP